MKTIKNKDRLESILTNESPEWQKTVYNETGVIAHFYNSGKGDLHIDLLSPCGYIDAETDAFNSAGYCEISSISGFIDNILRSKSYSKYLKDVSLGAFSKAQLFWNVYSRILRAEENIKNKSDSFILSSISCNDDVPIHHLEEEICLSIKYAGADELHCYINKSDCCSIDCALMLILNEIRAICDDIDFIQSYKVYSEYRITPPQTYNELKEYVKKYRIFPQ